MQSVMDLTADTGASSLILARSHAFAEIDHEIISMAILLPQLIQEGLLKYVHEVLVICLVKLSEEKKCG